MRLLAYYGIMQDDSPTIGIDCWVCTSKNIVLARAGFAPQRLCPEHFAITDSAYGCTLDRYACRDCGFLFCPYPGDVTGYYEALVDEPYEHTRPARAKQARQLLRVLRPYAPGGALLDIGAGSGILVEEALAKGYEATGIEPSAWLAGCAHKRHLPVMKGVFPQVRPERKQDVITLIDVLEHVPQPVPLLRAMAESLHPGGVVMVVTPDVGSWAARILQRKWWHYRIAHIGYFNRDTLQRALQAAGLKPIAWARPRWYLPGEYLVQRLGRYIPPAAALSRLAWVKRRDIAFHFFDSWTVIAQKHDARL